MGTYANFFIEAKINGKWELVKGYHQFQQKECTKFDFEGVPHKYFSEPDLKCTDGASLTKCESLWRQGYIRDIFSNSYYNEGNLANRGFPKDMSAEIKEIFDEKYKRIEDEKAEYFGKYGVEKTWGGKWWWGETYATLDELRGLFDKKYEEWKREINESINAKLTDSILVKKNDELFNLLNDVFVAVGGKKKKEKKIKVSKEDTDYPSERIDYLLEDELFDLMSLNSFIGNIEAICELLSYDESSDIRVIVWLD